MLAGRRNGNIDYTSPPPLSRVFFFFLFLHPYCSTQPPSDASGSVDPSGPLCTPTANRDRAAGLRQPNSKFGKIEHSPCLSSGCFVPRPQARRHGTTGSGLSSQEGKVSLGDSILLTSRGQAVSFFSRRIERKIDPLVLHAPSWKQLT